MAFPSPHSGVQRITGRRTDLLVSVRSLDEADIVSALHVRVIDLKEPIDGPLAPTSPTLWHAVSTRPFNQDIELSVALGECSQALGLAEQVPEQFTFAKAGPADCGTAMELAIKWRQIRNRLHPSVQLVAVAYADNAKANCPPPLEIFKAAADANVSMWLIDTFEKNGRSTLDHVDDESLRQIAEHAVGCDCRWTLAGSIKRSHLKRIERSGAIPNLIGIRGDVCDETRCGEIVPAKVADWIGQLNILNGRRMNDRLGSNS